MNNVTQDNSLRLNWWGHKMDAKDIPTLDDDGEYSSYAKCSKCGAVENTKASITICPKADYIHISVYSTTLEQVREESEKEKIILINDINYAIGHMQGCGHTSKYLEKKYSQQTPEEKE